MARRSRTAGICLALALALLASFALTPHQPSYKGRSLDSWLRDLDYGSARGVEAHAAIRAMGTNALPRIIEHLNHRDSLWKQRLWLYAQSRGIWRARIENDFLWHRRAARACGELGLSGQSMLPVLAVAVTNSQAPEQVVEALDKMLPNSACVLTNVVVSCSSLSASQLAIKSLGHACSYPEVSSMSVAGLSNAVHRFVTGADAIVALARIRDGNYPPATRAEAAGALESFQPIPQYSEEVKAWLAGRRIDELPQMKVGGRMYRGER